MSLGKEKMSFELNDLFHIGNNNDSCINDIGIHDSCINDNNNDIDKNDSCINDNNNDIDKNDSCINDELKIQLHTKVLQGGSETLTSKYFRFFILVGC